MHIKSSLIVFLFASLTFTAFSAKPFPGYYVNLEGDTISCNFKFNDWSANPSTITVTANNKEQTFGPNDIKAFGIVNYGDFESALVSYHPGSINGLYVTDEYTNTIENKKVFLKKIVAGRYTLYELNTSLRPYYFISEMDSTPVELLYRVRQKDMKFEEDQAFRKTIFEFYSRENISYLYMDKINTCRYSAGDIGHLVRTLNTNLTGKKYNNTQKQLFELDLYAGIIHNTFPSAFSGLRFDGNKLNASTSPTAGINIVYVLPNHFHAFAVGVSLGYDHYQSTMSRTGVFKDSMSPNFHSTTTASEEYHFSNSVLLINLYGRYIINPLSKFKVYIKAGLNGNISSEKDRDIVCTFHNTTSGVRNGNPSGPSTNEGTQTVLSVKGMYFNLDAAIGMQSGRHKIEFNYYVPQELFDKEAFKIGMIGGTYYFNLLNH